MPTTVTPFLATHQDYLFDIATDTLFASVQFSGAGFAYNTGATDLVGGSLELAVVTVFPDASQVSGADILFTYYNDQIGGLNIGAAYTPGGALNFAETAFLLMEQDITEQQDRHHVDGYIARNVNLSDAPDLDAVNTGFNDVWVAQTATMMRGGQGDDILETSATGAVLRGGWGDDLLVLANAGSGKLIAGGGDDVAFTEGSGNTFFRMGAGNDTATGGSGDDRLFGDDGEDVLIGGLGNDTLRGGADDDYLDAGLGNNLLDGGFGDDTIRAAGPGRDTIFGGDGADQFWFEIEGPSGVPLAVNNPSGNQTEFALIRDFDLAEDQLFLDNMAATDRFSFGRDAFMASAENEGNHVVYNDGVTRIKILDVQVEEFQWFNFFGVVEEFVG